MKKFPHKISIHPVANGFIVKVGCQEFVFNSPRELGLQLNNYFNDPEGTEKIMQETYGIGLETPVCQDTLGRIERDPRGASPVENYPR